MARPMSPDALRLDADPLRQFAAWLADAEQTELRLPNAMALATAAADGTPSLRMLLLRGVDERGFVFFTNRQSRKSRELAARPRAAACFYWEPLDRQVRIEGLVEPLSDEESATYFATRPRGSQLSAWASRQSEPLGSPDELEQRLAELAARFGEGEVPLPPFWGGYRVVPSVIEFWESRPDRLHQRLEYRRRPGGAWEQRRLQP
jgi:pyridoxamine 5'-phosphate oxidase